MAVTVTVEDGSGIAGANSVQSVAAWKVYADQHGWNYVAYSNDQIGAALIRSMAWLDTTYRSRLPGVRSYGLDQTLAWPRKAGTIEYGEYIAEYPDTVSDSDGLYIETDEIPIAWIAAHAEATWRELVSPGVLAPDMERGGAVRRLKAGSVEVEYATTAAAGTTFSIIDGLLAGILTGASESSGFTARAVRA